MVKTEYIDRWIDVKDDELMAGSDTHRVSFNKLPQERG